MAAHLLLSYSLAISINLRAGRKDPTLMVTSYGVGTQVRLPGPSPNKPNVYPFGVAYAEILSDLSTRPEREMYPSSVNQSDKLTLLAKDISKTEF